MERVLDFARVTKRYGDTAVLRQVTVEVRTGERVALLGRNGSGKSTLIRLGLGIVRPSEGDCYLMERPVTDAESRRRVGYLPQSSELPARLRVREIFDFVRDIKGASVRTDLIEQFGLIPYLDVKAGALSQGERRRVLLTIAFTGNPDLLILDEPTANLDGLARSQVWRIIKAFAEEGGSVVLASHNFVEIAALAQRAIVLAGGGVKADRSVDQLVATSGLTALEIDAQVSMPASTDFQVLHLNGRTVVLTKAASKVLPCIIDRAESTRVLERKPTVEEVCLALGGGAHVS